MGSLLFLFDFVSRVLCGSVVSNYNTRWHHCHELRDVLSGSALSTGTSSKGPIATVSFFPICFCNFFVFFVSLVSSNDNMDH